MSAASSDSLVNSVAGFAWPVRVYYEDTDAGGVVYYANYLKFLERARTERLRAAGFEQDALRREDGILFAVRSVEVDYLKPARFNDALLVTAGIAAVRHASVNFEQSVYRAAAPELILCRAKVRVVCLAADDLSPRPIPSHLLQRIKDDV